MQAASAGGGAKKDSTAMKRYGPIIGIAVAVVIGIVAVIAFTGDDDKKSTSSTDTSAAAVETTEASTPTSEAAETTAAPEASAAESTVDTTPTSQAADTTVPTTEGSGEITYPLSFAQAEEQGIAVEWGDRCDTELGRVKVPDYFAAECYAPFTGDNGGETATGVTADEIKIVVYQGITGDPIIAYISDAVAVDDTNAQQAETMQGMVDYFETYYETYGRTVKLEFVEGSGLANDETAARADAVRIAQDIKPFMVWGGPALTSAFDRKL